MKNGIVIVGTTFVDIKGFPYNKYIPAGRNAGEVEFVHGGVGRNVAEDIANMELRPLLPLRMVWVCGWLSLMRREMWSAQSPSAL